MVTPEGRLVARLGSPRLETFLRSAAKPFQALPLLEGGGAERYRLEPADVALICGSHRGRPEQVERAGELLARQGLEADRLQCGAHAPFDEESAAALSGRGEEPGPLHNNCSGKHAGMLLACRLFDWPLDGYLEPDHPLQRRIVTVLATVCGIDASKIGIAVDGCSAPCFRIPLEAAARGYAALADPDATALDPKRTAALETVAESMAAAPEMVAGPGAFTTRLIEVTAGRVLGKEGAQGVYGVAVRGPVALGMVLKIADGSEAIRAGVVLDLLRQLGSLSAAELGELEMFHRSGLTNWRGATVGELVPDVELEEVEAPR